MHNHADPANVLGLAHLENRDEGVYAFCEFNDTESGKTARELVKHGDVQSLSIFANQLKQAGHDVVHGIIREVSLVLAGANPGAFIDDVVMHGDGETGIVIGYNEMIMGRLEHSADELDKKKEEEKIEPNDKSDNGEKKDDKVETIEDIFKSMNEKQQTAVFAMMAEFVDKENPKKEDDESKGGDDNMKHNVFDTDKRDDKSFLSHADQEEILKLAKTSQVGTFQSALEIYANENALQHDALASGFAQTGDGNVTLLFPEYKDVRPGAPELITNDQGWITTVMNKVHKSPISRIRTRQADIRNIDTLRAKGYKKGKEKAQAGNFKLVRRTTDPQTVYIKDALNRDDIVDITDFDYVSYLYNIDRMMLNEELATAIMLGDGRDDGDEGKISPDHIRPIWLDDDLYTIHVDLDVAAAKKELQGTNTAANFGENYIIAEGLVSWFTGDNDLGSFGDSLVQFGSGIKSYSDSISGIDTGIMSSVITQVNRLVEMAKGMAELDTSGMSGFSTALIQLGNNGIDGFINAFTDASGRVTSAATSMLTTFINAANAQKGNLTSTFTTMMQAVLTTLTNYQTQFNTAGSTLMTKFISGIKSQDGNTKTAITNIISGCITAINNKQTQFNTAGANLMIKLIAGVKSKDYETRNAFVNILSSCLTAIANKYLEFQNAGMQCMIKFIAGVKEKAEEVKTAFTGNLNASVTAIRDYHDQFKQAGAYLVEGFADGISENTYRAEAKARAMARAAAEAAEDELDEHSPSRVGYHIGDFFGLGFVNAIGTYAVKAYNASAEMADSAKTGLGNAIAKVKDMIDNGVDGQPTIRPILDLSDVEEKSHRLNTLFSRSQALTVSTGIAAARGRNLQNEDTNPNTGNSYNFTQNNYSPKALSRTEIYRQTKNQFSAMERMVET